MPAGRMGDVEDGHRVRGGIPLPALRATFPLRGKGDALECAPMTIYALGPFRLDTRSERLLLEDKPVAVSPRALVLLRVLVEQRGGLVTKSALVEAAWPGRTVEDNNLAVQIAALRRALAAVAGGERWVETSSGRGYRFVGPVAVVERAIAEQTEAIAEAPPELTLPDRPSLAVLPFEDRSLAPGQEYFADGMVEDITTELSRFRELFVIARTSTFGYRGKRRDVRKIARELGVRYVLEGSARRSPSTVRVTAQLSDALSGRHLWDGRYDRAASDIFAVQDEITASVAAVIEPALAQAEQRRALRKPPDRLDAWEAYQRGLWHFHKLGAQDNQAAQAFFNQAKALDPNFAPGHYGHALALYWDSWLYSARPFADLAESALAEARLAVVLDDRDATGRAAHAIMQCVVGDFEGSVSEGRTALALNPNSAFVISTLGLMLGRAGHHQEAIDRLRQAMRASPNDPLTWQWLNGIADFQLFRGQYEPALESYRQVIARRPQFFSPHLYAAACLAYLGRAREAREALASAQAQFGEQIARRRNRPPWARAEDWAIKTEGLRLAAGTE